MRRENRHFQRNNFDIKRGLYIVGGVLSLSVIAFVAIFLIYGSNKTKSSQLAKFNTSAIDDYTNSIEETSSQMGRTVNEMQNEETNVVTNEVTNEETNEVSNQINTNATSEDKYAINTSNVENKNEEKEANAENEKKEEIKDPEFKMPVEGEILREFAKDNLVYSATLDEWITHNGIDIVAEKTSVVKAAADGVVKSIKNDPRYGLTVVIEHTNGFTSVYSNLLTAEFIEEGENVKQGQTIATVGNTATFEIADESHLHFEILKNSENIDPELYLK